MSGNACLVIVHPPDSGTGLIVLPQGKFVIGREESCNLDDSMASRQHACIEAEGSDCTISDSGSRNGTFVNDERVIERALAPGDFIRIGMHVMKFLCSDHVEAQYHETIYSMMITDGLTGVYNKRFFGRPSTTSYLARSVTIGRFRC